MNIGNYWSDWAEPDNDSDGVVDLPYEIIGPANAKDHYPLVTPSYQIIPIAEAGADIVIDQYQSVTFDSSGCSKPKFISNYTWSFTYNDTPQKMYGPAPTFKFEIAGVYKVTLNVMNFHGRGTEDTVIVTVRDLTYPIADAGGNISVDQHQTVVFDGNNSTDNIGIVNYTWIFKYDGMQIILYGESSSFVFHDAGQYFVTLKVHDTEGNRAEDTIMITVNDITLPFADAGPDMIINQSDTVEFFFHQNSSDNVGCLNWTWIFEYDSIDQTLFHSLEMSSLPSFTFEIPGICIVTMNVTDEAGNWVIDTLNITVLDNESPEAHAGNDTSTNITTPFHFDGLGSGDNTEIVNYTWTFEYDGKMVILYGPDPFFKFEIPGEYTVTLNVTDREGNCAEDHLWITVHPIDEIPPDDDDTDGGEEQEEKETSTYIIAGIILLAFLIAIIAIFTIFLRKQKVKDQGEEVEFGRIDQKDRPVVEDEDKDDDTQRKNE